MAIGCWRASLSAPHLGRRHRKVVEARLRYSLEEKLIKRFRSRQGQHGGAGPPGRSRLHRGLLCLLGDTGDSRRGQTGEQENPQQARTGTRTMAGAAKEARPERKTLSASEAGTGGSAAPSQGQPPTCACPVPRLLRPRQQLLRRLAPSQLQPLPRGLRSSCSDTRQMKQMRTKRIIVAQTFSSFAFLRIHFFSRSPQLPSGGSCAVTALAGAWGMGRPGRVARTSAPRRSH